MKNKSFSIVKNVKKQFSKYLGFIFNNIDFSKEFHSDLLEWVDEENRFYKIKHDDKEISNNLLFQEENKKIITNNSINFLNGHAANNVLLWGARGTGKSSLVLSLYGELSKKYNFTMLEIKFSQIKYFPKIIRHIEKRNRKTFVFCDDFSFDCNDDNYILFKNTLEGSLRSHPDIIFYVTSNYRHLIKDNIEMDSNGTHSKDKIENFISLSDRFGIWLGFHNFSNQQFIKIVFSYCNLYNLKLDKEQIKKKALEWSVQRGSNSGREAVNLVRYLLAENYNNYSNR